MGWLSSLASSAGDLMGDLFQSSKAARRQFGYQKQMMQNAHQWEVADLRKAGLNPILSAGGSGASGSVGAPVVTTSRLSSSQGHGRRVEQILHSKQAGLLEAQTDAQKELANMYSSSAKQNEENAKALKRLNKYFDAHPDVFDLKQANEAGGTVGIAARAMQVLSSDIAPKNSAKHLDSTIRNYPKGYFYEDSK